MRIGNGEKITFVASLAITETSEVIPNSFTLFSKANFPDLVFSVIENESLILFNENTGIFEFLLTGHLNVNATISFDTAAQPAEFYCTPFLDSGSGFQALNSRCSEFTILSCEQIILMGNVFVKRGDKLKFDVKGIGNPVFKTITLENSSIIPAGLINFELKVK